MEGYCSTGQSPQGAVVPMEKKKIPMLAEPRGSAFLSQKTIMGAVFNQMYPLPTNTNYFPNISLSHLIHSLQRGHSPRKFPKQKSI
jgi:hypothetical protein